ncbi:glycoside hydrolase family 95 protein [Candidatus Bathyarchaeota archaeon]|nr:glycoside hydrolase family 95 protein [Candidatus Bathyarchaeota archaeon]
MHDAIPIGNGRLGALIYGITDQEKITLNEDSIWSGGFTNRVNPKSAEAFPRVRELLDDGDYVGANQEYLDGLVGTPEGQRAYQPAGQLSVVTGHLLDDGGVYNRSLDVASGIASTSYESGGVLYSREAVANFPTGVLAFRFSGEGSSVSLNVTLERAEGVVSQTTEGDTSVLMGEGTDDPGYTFASALRVKAESGEQPLISTKVFTTIER